MNNVTGYINYFRQLAVIHSMLRHDVASETGDCPPGAQRFAKISVDQVLKALPSKMGFPAMTLELYDTETNAENVYDIRQRPKGAFMVIDKPHDTTFAEEERCYADTETIVYQLLRKIWQDIYKPGIDRCLTPFKDFSFDKISITPVGPIFNNQFGYRIEFDFTFQNNINIATANEPGVFD